MYESAIKLLKEINSYGYEAYIIGGFPRDLYLKRNSTDVDICTDATPMELHKIFPEIITACSEYGTVTILYENIKFEISTFRKEYNYKDNRHPNKIDYVETLEEDIGRRDFTINTLAIDANERQIDILGAKKDLDNKIIKMVGNPRLKLKEDALRILRAIRFATILNFEIDPRLKYYIKRYGHLLRKISSDIKKNELDLIFSNPNKEYGIKLLIELKLDNHLGLNNLKRIKITPSMIVTWSELNVLDKYNFNTLERESIIKINEAKEKNILDKHILYEYGLYVCTMAAELKDIDKKRLNSIFSKLPIRSKLDIVLTPIEICKILNKEAGPYLKPIINDLEYQIIDGTVKNEKRDLEKYIKEKYL
ncbi:MAG: hypothetical protein IKF82_06095 [Bacilli bacterium]|nr:hypothetical protein [Bacilli bacterium]MBR3209819.1 hypothetical protein [Bacilli bacterium]